MLARSVAIPTGVHHVRLHTTRGEFAALVAEPSARPAGLFLLVPGFTGSKEDFAPLLPLLADAGWKAVAYDQRGQYETAAGPGADLSLEALAADARAVAMSSGVGGDVHLLGHSFGGLVTQAAVVREPAAWTRATLLCTGPGAFTDADGAAKRRDLTRLRELLAEQPMEVVQQIRERHDLAQGVAPPAPDVAQFLRRRFLASSPTAVSAHAGHLLEAPDQVDALAATRVPVAVIRGGDDDAWSWAAQDEMAARLKTTVVVVEDAAHSPSFENPAALAAVLAGLRSSAS
jgi:pimeloyl-ACP methyl ester carboxylesterase